MELRRERGNEANAPPNAARIPERTGGDCIQNVRGEGDLRWSVMDEGMIPGGLPAARREKPKAPLGAKGVRNRRRGGGILFHPRTRCLLCIYGNKIKLAFIPLIDLNLGSWLPL